MHAPLRLKTNPKHVTPVPLVLDLFQNLTRGLLYRIYMLMFTALYSDKGIPGQARNDDLRDFVISLKNRRRTVLSFLAKVIQPAVKAGRTTVARK